MCRYVTQTRPCGHEHRVTEYCMTGNEARGVMCNSEPQYILKKKFNFCRVVGCKYLGVRISTASSEKPPDDAASVGEATASRAEGEDGAKTPRPHRVDSIYSSRGSSPNNKTADEAKLLYRSIREVALDSEPPDAKSFKGPLAAPFVSPPYPWIQHITHQNADLIKTPQQLQEPYVTQTPTLGGVDDTTFRQQPRSSYPIQEFSPLTFPFMPPPVPQEKYDAWEWEKMVRQAQRPYPQQRDPTSTWGRLHPFWKFHKVRSLWEQASVPSQAQSAAPGRERLPALGQEQQLNPNQEHARTSERKQSRASNQEQLPTSVQAQRRDLGREQPPTPKQGQTPFTQEKRCLPAQGQPSAASKFQPAAPVQVLLNASRLKLPPSGPQPGQLPSAPGYGLPSGPRQGQPQYTEQWPLPGQSRRPLQRQGHSVGQGGFQPRRVKPARQRHPHFRGGLPSRDPAPTATATATQPPTPFAHPQYFGPLKGIPCKYPYPYPYPYPTPSPSPSTADLAPDPWAPWGGKQNAVAHAHACQQKQQRWREDAAARAVSGWLVRGQRARRWRGGGAVFNEVRWAAGSRRGRKREQERNPRDVGRRGGRR
jgi:hypothetical protein